MTAFSNYLESEILDAAVKQGTYTGSATYLALFTSSANLEANIITDELSGGGYARQAIVWGTPSDGVVNNASAITFPQATADWSAVYAMAIMDAATGGNVLFWTPTGKKEVFASSTLNIAVAELTIVIK